MFRTTTKIALFCVFMVIIAGSVVRMTGSGMGCPDWPKCFGHLIPPIDKSELLWQPNQEFHKGQVIIKDESLKVAREDFKSGASYSPANWSVYTKHDYAEFNPFHTWVEFINRLFGMLSGIAILIMAVIGTLATISYYKTCRKRIIFLSWLSVLLIGFEAWLGAVVVYSVLQPIKITIHMAVSMVIIGVLLYLITLTGRHSKRIIFNKQFKNLMVISLALTLLQILLGTRVRQYVDIQVAQFGYDHPGQWLASPTVSFYIHRSLSIAVLALNAFLWWKNRNWHLGHRYMNTILGLILLEIIIGIGLYYFNFPFLSQPLHLLVALLLFAAQFYVVLHSLKSQTVPVARGQHL